MGRKAHPLNEAREARLRRDRALDQLRAHAGKPEAGRWLNLLVVLLIMLPVCGKYAFGIDTRSQLLALCGLGVVISAVCALVDRLLARTLRKRWLVSLASGKAARIRLWHRLGLGARLWRGDRSATATVTAVGGEMDRYVFCEKSLAREMVCEVLRYETGTAKERHDVDWGTQGGGVLTAPWIPSRMILWLDEFFEQGENSEIVEWGKAYVEEHAGGSVLASTELMRSLFDLARESGDGFAMAVNLLCCGDPSESVSDEASGVLSVVVHAQSLG